jgi:hypothetical protein
MRNTGRHHPNTVRQNLLFSVFALVILAGCGFAHAGELGHFNPGVPCIRDFVVPEPGFYGLLYNYFYTSGRLNDRNGNKVDSVTIKSGPAPGLTLGVDVNLNLYALSPMFIWVSPCEVAGARYAAYIAPSFATSSLGASLTAANGRGIGGDIDSRFGVGDLFVQPLWLGWPLDHWDFALGYGFYAPLGRYNVETIALPIIGPLKAEAPDNIGLGFWTHQIQGAVAWYPWTNRGTAVVTALTYEIHHEKQDFDITPGSHLTLNWGISQYLPLTKDKKLMLEFGPAGYSQWKVTDDSGSETSNGDVLDQVHAAGGQLGLTYVPWNAALNFHYLYEFESRARFQGQVCGLDLGVKF